MILQISQRLMNEIRAHAARSYPHECCGALLGTDAEEVREVTALHPLVNRHADSPHNRYTVGPEDFRQAERLARAAGLNLIGWYHSHPGHPAIPSAFDREHAWPWFSYVIVSVQKGVAAVTASWRLQDDRQEFQQETVEVSTAQENLNGAQPSLVSPGEK